MFKSLVFPYHDPKNIESKYLREALTLLKKHFRKAYLSVTPQTVTENPKAIAYLRKDTFFVVNTNPIYSKVGDHFVSGFKNAVQMALPEEILCLCTLDRLTFALLSDHRNAFLNDLEKLNTKSLPMLFLRSPGAWATHPKSYLAVESMVTEVGKILFDKTLDFAWCHICLTTAQLKSVLKTLTAHDLVVFAQLVFSLKQCLKTKEVDWLAWEDPFIFNKNPIRYRRERDRYPKEVKKRMTYALLMIKYLFSEYQKGSKIE
jgi:hypothetical protein